MPGPNPTGDQYADPSQRTTRNVSATSTAADPLNRDYIGSQLDALYARYGATPGARGSGPLDREYYIDEVARTGGWVNGGPTADNIGYWSDKIGRDLTAHGYAPTTGTGTPPAAPTTPAPAPAPAPSGPTPLPWNPWSRGTGGTGPSGSTGPTTPSGGTGTVPPWTPIPVPPQAPIPGPTAQYGSPNEVASRQKKRPIGQGRTSTILGGFGSSAPATRPATLLGKA